MSRRKSQNFNCDHEPSDHFTDSDYQTFLHSECSYFTNRSYLPSSTNVDHSQRQSISPGRLITFTIDDKTLEGEEPPLLDELEIYPERIVQKSLSILNPFQCVDDITLTFSSDLAGPIGFCLFFGVCLFFAAKRAMFGYIYSLSMASIVAMYVLVGLLSMPPNQGVPIDSIASSLGYGFLPIVLLSILSIFFELKSFLGLIISLLAILSAARGSSKMLCIYMQNPSKRLLIAYPCTLIYVAFTILTIF